MRSAIIFGTIIIASAINLKYIKDAAPAPIILIMIFTIWDILEFIFKKK